MSSKTDATGTTTYQYDAENRLVQVVTPSDGTWQYTYDALGNRTTVNHDGVVTKYVHDPIGLVDVAAEYDGSGALVARYTHGLGLVSRTAAASSQAYYAFDAIGHTRQLTDEAGAVVNTYDYAPFGEPLQVSETIANPFRYVGRFGVMEEGTGLEFMRMRYYDSGVGSFVSQDPVDIMGEFNLYRYVGNNPVNWTDPIGLLRWGQFFMGISQIAGGAITAGVGICTTLPSAGVSAVLTISGAITTGSGIDNVINSFAKQNGAGLNTGGLLGESAMLFFPSSETAHILGRIGDDVFSLISDKLGSKILYKVPQLIADIPTILNAWGDIWYGWGKAIEGFNKVKVADGQTQVVTPHDPNEKTATAGVGTQHYVARGDEITYQIYFENKSTATAPAQEVFIDDTLDSNLDWSTFQLGEIAFGNQVVSTLSGMQSGADSVPAGNMLVDIIGTYITSTGQARWTLRTIDPATGDLPADVFAGFLPPEDGTGRGQGYVTFKARTRTDTPSETQIKNTASIVFDTEAPISTNEVFNTISDAAPDAPSGPSPADTASNVPMSAVLTWTSSQYATAYDIYLWKSSQSKPTTPTASGLTSPFYDPPGDLEAGTNYLWQVTARNAMGATDGPVWTFMSATFSQFTLTVNKKGDGSGTVTSSELPQLINCGTMCSGQYDAGTVVILTATPNSGTTFTGWSGSCVGNSPTCTVTMDAAKSVTAVFGTNTQGAYVSGIIDSDTTWTFANSPYVVNGSVLVSNGVTLMIEPCVTIKFDNDKALEVDGTLIARGTSTCNITFTSSQETPAPGDWGYILFSDSSTDATYDVDGNYTGGSILEYAVVEYAGGASVFENGAVRMNNAHPFINYSVVRSNSASGIYAWNLTGNLTVANCTIYENVTTSSGGGIHVTGRSNSTVPGSSGTITVSDSLISKNTASYAGGISVDGGTTAEIMNNSITHNIGGGIFIDNFGVGGLIGTISNNMIMNNSASSGAGINIFCGNVNIDNNRITNNVASSNGGGILIDTYPAGWSSGPVDIQNNVITNNSSNSGGGIYVFDSYLWITPVPTTISKNIVNNNIATDLGGGIFAGSYTTTILNNSINGNSARNASAIYYASADDKDFKSNTIVGNIATGTLPTYTMYVGSHPVFNYNNLSDNIATYEFWNDNAQGSANVNAENNWWGTADSSVIENKIWHWVDDSSKGLVDYTPYSNSIRTDAPISPPTGLVTIPSIDQISLSWNANPEGDLAGYKVYWGTTPGFPYANMVDVGNMTNYTIPGPIEGTYYVTLTAYDQSYNPASDDPDTIVNENQTNGNESWYATEKIADFTPPTGSVVINNGANVTKTVSVTLTLTASDDSLPIQMCISNTTSCTTWEPFMATKEFTLTAGDGTKTVYAWFKDKAGNSTPGASPYSDDIILDTTPPDTLITGDCPGTTNNTTASFTFTSDEAGTFQCKIDNAAFTKCTSPKAYAGLKVGSHTFTVRAMDLVGNFDLTPAKCIWTVDLTPPNSPIVSSKTPTNDTSPTWTWVSGGGGNGTFRYKLDSADMTTGTASTTAKTFTPVTALDGGLHALYVQEQDTAGNWSASGSFAIVVDTTAPATTISSNPANPSKSATASFSFTSSEADSTFLCQMDAGSWVACTSPKPYSGLIAGSHTFSVKAIDAAGNTDATPAIYIWTIDLTVPSLGAVTPTPITTEQGKAQIFTAIYSDTDGYANLKTVELLVNTTLTVSNGIRASYNRTTNLLTLYNNAGGAAQGTCTPGSVGITISNTQGTLNCQQTTITKAGNNITVKWSITPAAGFASTTTKKIFTKATDMAGNVAAWTQKATWKILGTNTAPILGTLTPSAPTSAANTAKVFTAVYSDVDGYANLKTVDMLVTASATGTANGIYVRYDRSLNKLYLYNDAGTTSAGNCAPGEAKTVSNTRGTLNCAATTKTVSGNNLTVKWSITPKAVFTGAKLVKLRATDNSALTTGLVQKGTWTITAAAPASQTEEQTYSVITYGTEASQPYAEITEETIPTTGNEVEIQTEPTDSSGTGSIRIGVRKAPAVSPEGVYTVITHSTEKTSSSEYTFDGKGRVSIKEKNADGTYSESISSYTVTPEGRITIGDQQGQIQSDGELIVLTTTPEAIPSLTLGTKKTGQPVMLDGEYEGAGLVKKGNSTVIKTEDIALENEPSDSVIATQDGEIIIIPEEGGAGISGVRILKRK
jgi:RHS repeat-associated protein